MKKLLFSTALIACCLTSIFSQPCLPEGIAFTSQSQIDSFQINYPGCTEIEGDVEIGSWSWGNTEISNLDSLNVVTFIGGNLWIHHNSALTNLTGLNNIASMGGDLEISFNPGLTSLNGLENLISIDGELRIGVLYYYSQGGNSSLTNLVGLDNLNTIGGGLEITDNDALVNLTGLTNLDNIGADLVICRNDSIINLTGLENLNSIGGNLKIGQDWSNGNYSLLNLSGLDNLASIGGSLEIIRNPALTSLTGLENLSTIGGSLIIGSLYPNSTGNPSLTNIISLENVTSIGGVIYVNCNNVLINLNGLDNIDAGSISGLTITNNSSLSNCDVQSICNYLAAPGGTVGIGNNAPGCNSPEEVENACDTVLVDEISYNNSFSISPNPCSSTLRIRFTISDQRFVILDLFEISGFKVKSILNEEMLPGNYEQEIDLSDLRPGVYFCVLKTKEGIQTTKLIKI